MLELYIYQLRGDGTLIILIEAIIFYNLYQLLKQTQLVYFLLYKLLFILYLGWLLIYFDLDIFAFLLWIIYGGFIAVVFIFSFVWTDVTYFKYTLNNSRRLNFFIVIFLFILIFLYTNICSIDISYYLSIFTIGWTNFYEVSLWDVEDELEFLGWIIGFENSITLLIVSFILSIACLILICIISGARKIKYLILTQRTYMRNARFFLSFKIQNFFIQESGSVGIPKQALKLFHRRRT